MTIVTTRREERQAQRRDLDGTGPTLEERPGRRYPGATGAFALLGEVILTGLLIAAGSLALITLPAALAAGIRHLRRYVDAEDSRLVLVWADFRAALLPGMAVGAVAVVATGLLLLDIDLARSGFLPGGDFIAIVGWAGLAVVAIALLGSAGAWTPDTGWRAALRSVPRSAAHDPFGAVYLVAAAGFVGVATWMLVPLFVPAIGCAALAVIAVPTRRRRAARNS